MSDMPNADVYWAANPSAEEAVAESINRRETYRKWLTETGRAGRIARSWATYYGQTPTGDGDTSQVLAGGEQGELARDGSRAAPGYMQPEGVVVFTVANGVLYKKTFGGDGHKGKPSKP
jgi:hypothetical protein